MLFRNKNINLKRTTVWRGQNNLFLVPIVFSMIRHKAPTTLIEICQRWFLTKIFQNLCTCSWFESIEERCRWRLNRKLIKNKTPLLSLCMPRLATQDLLFYIFFIWHNFSISLKGTIDVHTKVIDDMIICFIHKDTH